MTDAQQRAQLDLLRQLNQEHAAAPGRTQADLAARIQSFELAYRMQIGRSRGARHRAGVASRCRSCTAWTAPNARRSAGSA